MRVLRSRLGRGLLIVAVAAVVALAGVRVGVQRGSGGDFDFGPGSASIRLGLPAGAQSLPGDAFPQGSAGMSALLKLPSVDIDTVVTSGLFLNPTLGANYLRGRLGSVYVYLDSDGWIVGWLSRSTPTAAMIAWNQPAASQFTGRTTMDLAVEEVLNVLGISYSSVATDLAYFHFRYPDARTVQFIIERPTVDESFFLAIPLDFTILNQSAGVGGGPGGSVQMTASTGLPGLNNSRPTVETSFPRNTVIELQVRCTGICDDAAGVLVWLIP